MGRRMDAFGVTPRVAYRGRSRNPGCKRGTVAPPTHPTAGVGSAHPTWACQTPSSSAWSPHHGPSSLPGPSQAAARALPAGSCPGAAAGCRSSASSGRGTSALISDSQKATAGLTGDPHPNAVEWRHLLWALISTDSPKAGCHSQPPDSSHWKGGCFVLGVLRGWAVALGPLQNPGNFLRDRPDRGIAKV